MDLENGSPAVSDGRKYALASSRRALGQAETRLPTPRPSSLAEPRSSTFCYRPRPSSRSFSILALHSSSASPLSKASTAMSRHVTGLTSGSSGLSQGLVSSGLSSILGEKSTHDVVRNDSISTPARINSLFDSLNSFTIHHLALLPFFL